MTNILDGRKVSIELKEILKEQIKNLNLKLVVISVGDDEASKIYIKNKEKSCSLVNIKFLHISYTDNVLESEIISKIEELNNDDSITSILVQLPINKKYNSKKIIDTIIPSKDVDGLTTTNIGLFNNNRGGIIPCTAKGILSLLRYYNISVESKNICIVGKSNLVGKPIGTLLLNEGATVTVCHSKTKDLFKHTKNADIIICAVGKANLINKNMIKKDCVVIDVGINRIDNRIVGDVNFDEVSSLTSFISPVPGGVGPMTIVSLLENVYECYKVGKKL